MQSTDVRLQETEEIKRKGNEHVPVALVWGVYTWSNIWKWVIKTLSVSVIYPLLCFPILHPEAKR